MDNRTASERLAEQLEQREQDLASEQQAKVDARWEGERVKRRDFYIRNGGSADTFDKKWAETKHALLLEAESEEARRRNLARKGFVPYEARLR
jgi:hypothetical protein